MDNMENKRDKKTIQINKNDSTNIINNYLQDLIDSDNDNNLKKADLISFWLKSYTNYIKNENSFEPLKQENYKRGNIVKLDLGFNIGNEEGGLHYAIVVNNPDKSSWLVTIVPLTSKKSNSKLHKSEVSLGFSLVVDIITKLSYLYVNISSAAKDTKTIENRQERIKEQKKLKRMCVELQKYINEAKKMKNNESIALVGNITTISKQRIYTPTIKNKFLKGISISESQLDLIDKKIIELYTHPH